ncbi:MAG: hypothetical protein FJX77_03200, partial [Armatimonadetes bacterium]|nr:hypothetical protein [Armatimonadota bacterium]
MGPADGQEQARAEQLFREAHILRMRAQAAAAEGKCRQALALSPQDALGLELLGDLLLDQEKVEEAEGAYQQALEFAPGKESLETKLARIILERAEGDRSRLTAELLLSTPRPAREGKQQQTVAILLSLICAGGGQLVLGEHWKGGILLAFWLLSLLGAADAFKLLVGGMGGLDRDSTVDGGM